MRINCKILEETPEGLKESRKVMIPRLSFPLKKI